MPGDPYAEFGGSQVASAPITNQDPYAEFGGRSSTPPQVQQKPNFGSRVGNRIMQNFNIPAQLSALKSGINEALSNPKLRTGGRLPEVWQSLKQNYSDPANILGDVLGGAMVGDVARFAVPEAPRPQTPSQPQLPEPAIEKQLATPGLKSAPAMEPVQSTNINKLGHDGNHMWVEYKSGQVYRYKNVPEEVFQQAKSADSVGSFIARNVKGKYDTSLRGNTAKK